MYELAFNLQLQDRKGELKDFISQINLHLKATPSLEALDNLLHIAHHPVSIHYDTVFNIGDYYLSTLKLFLCSESHCSLWFHDSFQKISFRPQIIPGVYY